MNNEANLNQLKTCASANWNSDDKLNIFFCEINFQICHQSSRIATEIECGRTNFCSVQGRPDQSSPLTCFKGLFFCQFWFWLYNDNSNFSKENEINNVNNESINNDDNANGIKNLYNDSNNNNDSKNKDNNYTIVIVSSNSFKMWYFLCFQMIPSPDWIVGLSKENLCLPNCSWVANRVIDLYPWDIGTQRWHEFDSILHLIYKITLYTEALNCC